MKGNTFTIDVFYLESIKQEALPRAKQIKELLTAVWPTFNIRLRLLPREVNARSGYRIDANQVRYEKGEETIAQKCLNAIVSKKIFTLEQPVLHEVKKVTSNYISVFVRNM